MSSYLSVPSLLIIGSNIFGSRLERLQFACLYLIRFRSCSLMNTEVCESKQDCLTWVWRPCCLSPGWWGRRGSDWTCRACWSSPAEFCVSLSCSSGTPGSTPCPAWTRWSCWPWGPRLRRLRSASSSLSSHPGPSPADHWQSCSWLGSSPSSCSPPPSSGGPRPGGTGAGDGPEPWCRYGEWSPSPPGQGRGWLPPARQRSWCSCSPQLGMDFSSLSGLDWACRLWRCEHWEKCSDNSLLSETASYWSRRSGESRIFCCDLTDYFLPHLLSEAQHLNTNISGKYSEEKIRWRAED